ncbi:MAG: DUF4199 domain-containing protein [Tannerellaceae bacterium]|jgi:hypothetical protein|nr:DUF4199 domain-containing protein [Tannerellaceae bacterium]
MKENKNLLLKSAMFYGLLLGIFWVIKYIFFILGNNIPSMAIIYWILTPLTLIIAHVFTKIYKLQIGGKIGFFHAWQFGVLLFFFAALIVSLVHFTYYRYIAPPELISSSMNQAIELMKDMNLNNQIKEMIEQMTIPTPIQITIHGIFNNIFYGLILSIPIAALLCRNNSTGFINTNNQEKGGNQ